MVDSTCQCCVCYEHMTESLSAAPCGHVMHTTCIETWKDVSPTCPICKSGLPPKLLKLFYTVGEPSSESMSSTMVNGSSTGRTSSHDGADDSGDDENRRTSDEGDPLDGPILSTADARKLRCKIASTNRVLEESKLATERSEKLARGLTEKIARIKATCAVRTETLEQQLAESQNRLGGVEIDLSKKHKEWFQLKRELGAQQKLLLGYRSERRANEYLSELAGRKSKVLNGLGQVSVEPLVEEVARGYLRAEDVIRGQHESLCRGMAHQQKTLQTLKKCRQEYEDRESRLNQELMDTNTRFKDAISKVNRLAAALVKARSEQTSRRPSSPSLGGIIDSADPARRAGPSGNGKENDRLSGRKRVRSPAAGLLRANRNEENDTHGYISLSDDADDDELDGSDDASKKRPRRIPAAAGAGRSKARWKLGSGMRGGQRDGAVLGEPASHLERASTGKEDGSFKSGDRADREVSDSRDFLRISGGMFSSSASAEPKGAASRSGTRLEQALGLGAPMGRSRSFRGTSKASSSSRGTYIRTGFNAMGGTHSVPMSAVRGLPEALRRSQVKAQTSRQPQQ